MQIKDISRKKDAVGLQLNRAQQGADLQRVYMYICIYVTTYIYIYMYICICVQENACIDIQCRYVCVCVYSFLNEFLCV